MSPKSAIFADVSAAHAGEATRAINAAAIVLGMLRLANVHAFSGGTQALSAATRGWAAVATSLDEQEVNMDRLYRKRSCSDRAQDHQGADSDTVVLRNSLHENPLLRQS